MPSFSSKTSSFVIISSRSVSCFVEYSASKCSVFFNQPKTFSTRPIVFSVTWGYNFEYNLQVVEGQLYLQCILEKSVSRVELSVKHVFVIRERSSVKVANCVGNIVDFRAQDFPAFHFALLDLLVVE